MYFLINELIIDSSFIQQQLRRATVLQKTELLRGTNECHSGETGNTDITRRR